MINTLFDNGTHKIQSAGVAGSGNSNAEPEKKVSKFAFKSRMTQTERIAIRLLAETDPVAFDFMDLVDSASYIDLSDQNTINGLNYLESKGCLTLGRANEILDAPIIVSELP